MRRWLTCGFALVAIGCGCPDAAGLGCDEYKPFDCKEAACDPGYTCLEVSLNVHRCILSPDAGPPDAPP
jgi:hypothetical protein